MNVLQRGSSLLTVRELSNDDAGRLKWSERDFSPSSAVSQEQAQIASGKPFSGDHPI